MNFLNNLITEIGMGHTLEVWLAGMYWSLHAHIGIKAWLSESDSYSKIGFFKGIKHWFNENIIALLKGLLYSSIVLALGDAAIHFIQEYIWHEMPETKSLVKSMIIISGFIQYYLTKKKKPFSKQLQNEFKAHLKVCNHK